jgi:hypothetical protein
MKKIERKNTKTISVTINKEIFNKINEMVNNKSKFTEWLFIKYLDEIGVDVKNIKF